LNVVGGREAHCEELEEATATIIGGGASRAGQLAGKLKDLPKNLHGRGNIYSTKNVNHGSS
jgi:hypothetical protein